MPSSTCAERNAMTTRSPKRLRSASQRLYKTSIRLPFALGPAQLERTGRVRRQSVQDEYPIGSEHRDLARAPGAQPCRHGGTATVAVGRLMHDRVGGAGRL